MSHPTRSTRRAAALALAVGLLSACSDSGASEDAAGASASTSATSESAATSSAAPESSAAAETSIAAPAPSTAGAPTEAEARTVTATEGEMFIELSEDSFSPGSYTIEVVNEGNATHDLVVERDGEDVAATENIAPGQSATLTVTLEAGEYVFYCSIGNHRAMGMETPVTVSA
ncbi:plastocyanin [Geodermatophilus bullaregiensis]|uniref:cupredoxin domain-containing protein n=1 Tax=Geodermatophilus bullaregiensis TaxID=1564160 RepID=UPI00195B5481|nr:plastocyanin/azurin family copper-binding protein [Geodermatophilus bullaregiensis]MBM7805308.1 plastocyanin [Geodermatophilus bullaregiensis]